MIEERVRGHDGGTQDAGANQHRPYRVHVPGFISDIDIGLGDAIKRVTFTVGIKTCGGCEKRAAALNRWLAFSGRRPR
jgi:hypothetical protein